MDERKYLVLTRSKQGDFKNTTKRVINVAPSDSKMLVTFQDGKSWPYNKNNVKYFEHPEAINIDSSIVKLKNDVQKVWNEAYIFGGRYAVLFINGCSETFPINEVEIIPNIAGEKETKHLIDYYRYITTLLKKSSSYLSYFYETKLHQIRDDSVLSNYVKGSSPKRMATSSVISPFGINPSQREAVKNALTSQISVIQGPPGTGKTQTILNIIANLLCQNKTVAVVAGNNAATRNIYEKLEKESFEFIAASLGNRELQEIFFSKIPDIPDITCWKLSEDTLTKTKQAISTAENKISELLELQNKQAETRELLSKLEIESNYFEKYFSVNPANPSNWSFGNNWSTPNLMRFMAEVEYYSKRGKLTWPLKFRWLFKYGIYKFKDMKELSSNLFKGLVSEYYRRKKEVLEESKSSIEKLLDTLDFEKLLERYTEGSMTVLKHHLYSKLHGMEHVEFSKNSYKALFDKFVMRFPIILSTTDSIINNKNELELFDYLIVDEASQVDLLTGVLSMSCAKNMVVVGDLKQIPHIPSQSVISTHSDIDQQFGIRLGYSYLNESLLSSLNKVFNHCAPSTLLKEHYRCHLRIIDFCNQKFYNNQLVIMTNSDSEPFHVIKTAPGHHTCQSPNGKSQINFREIEVIQEELLDASLRNENPEAIGIVTPYRAQVEKANQLIEKKGIKIDTAHKFQGREKDIIIYSPTASWADNFNDSPNLINVAVSRAKERFIMVISGKLLRKQGTNIGDLIRHIEYQTMSPSIFESKTVSIFDCLYSEYSSILQSFRNRISKRSSHLSENLIATLLDDILIEDRLTSFTYKHNYPLSLLINNFDMLNEREKTFGQNLNSHIDFLIFNRLDKIPVLAIEVDSYRHHTLNPKQRQRDEVKDSILSKMELPLLRLSTKRSGEKKKIQRALQDIIDSLPPSGTEQHESWM